jgi:hypothetical protein
MKEIVDTDALIERYRKEIKDLKRRLAERDAVNVNEDGARVGGGLKRRLSTKEVSSSVAISVSIFSLRW